MMSSNDLTAPFTLYHTLYSIRSLMIRMMLALRGPPRPGWPEMNLLQQEMDLGATESKQLTEFFLCKVNPDGRVPALTNDKLLPKPLHETLDITWYLCKWYPGLLPPENEAEIRTLIKELHEISFPVLTFGPKDQHALHLDAEVQQILGRDDISDEYRKALEHKSIVLRELHASIAAQDSLAENEARVEHFCAKIVALSEANGTAAMLTEGENKGYLYGSTPTALDAHVLVFLGRIQDTRRDYLLPDVLTGWINKFRKSDTWRAVVTLGEASTLPPHAG